MAGPIFVAMIVGFVLLRPRGRDGRPGVTFGEGFVGRVVAPPVVLGLAAAASLYAGWVLGLVE